MTRNSEFISTIASIVLLVLTGGGFIWLLSYSVPMNETSHWNHLLFTLIMIGLGLSIPYVMLKLLMHAAHVKNSQEKELELKDLPKDKDQLARSK